MGFPFLLHDPLHPPCAMRSLRYLLSPSSRAEQSLKAEHHICDLYVSLRGSKASQVFYFVNTAFHKTSRHLARSGGNAQKEIPYGISFLFYISYNKGREEAVRDGYR